MNFKQAVKWMKEGKKLRCGFWDEEAYIHLCNDSDFSMRWGGDGHSGTPDLTLNDYEATDWEIYENEDANWCLTERNIDLGSGRVYSEFQIKKMCDLIMEDFENIIEVCKIKDVD